METSYRIMDGHPAYRVGDDGSVWSRRNNRWGMRNDWRQLKPGFIKSKEAQDYRRAMVYLGRGNFRYVHHLVLQVFVGPRPAGCEACHRNGIPTDNRLENLYWGTPIDNDADQREHGRKKGERHHAATITDDIVREVRRRAQAGEVHQLIANDLGIQRRNVSRIANRSRWGHVV